MPWTGPEFRQKHAKDLSPAQAAQAAKQANAMLESGADEGVAIATAIKRAKHRPKYERLYAKGK